MMQGERKMQAQEFTVLLYIIYNGGGFWCAVFMSEEITIIYLIAVEV
jgi:hypothetical protein